MLHFVSQDPSYGNQLMDRIGALTAGALAVNPNTMYPLLRTLEADGHIAGEWEHPERRSRRFYRITRLGAAGARSAWARSCGRGWTASRRRSRRSGRRCSDVDWWFFREGTEAEARDYLARFLDEGAAWPRAWSRGPTSASPRCPR